MTNRSGKSHKEGRKRLDEKPKPQRSSRPVDWARWRRTVSGVALVVSLSVVWLWCARHLDWFDGWVSWLTSAGPILVLLWGYLKKKTLVDWFDRQLRQPPVFASLCTMCIAVLVLSFTLSSVHVSLADGTPAARVYVIDERGPSHAPGRTRFESSLDAVRNHRSSVFLLLRGRSYTIVASTGQQTPPRRIPVWRADTAVFPMDFVDTMYVANVLPSGAFLDDLARGHSLRLLVREDSGKRLLADTILTAFQSLAVSFTRLTPDTAAQRQRWLPLARDQLDLDADPAGQLVSVWMASSKWVAARRPLRRGDRVEFVLLRGTADSIARVIQVLMAPTTDVVLEKNG